MANFFSVSEGEQGAECRAGGAGVLPRGRWQMWGHLAVIWCVATALVACGSDPEVIAGGEGQGTGGSADDPLGMGKDNVVVGDDEPVQGTGGGSANSYVCGNGELEPGEICDDGGTEDGDGCDGDCLTQDPDFDCSEVGFPCVDTVVCGDGVIQGEEACDDSNVVSGDGCLDDCSAVEAGFVCARPGVDCLVLPVCGDGERQRGEQCDDGNDSDPADGCHECGQADGFFCVPGEACVALECGDGNRTPDEKCDDGNTTNGDGCSATCGVEAGWRCGTQGCVEDCGDGTRVGKELLGNGVYGDGPDGCDDGNRQSGDGCSAGCAVEPYFACSGATSNCSSTISCGNGVVEPGEVCETHTEAGAPLNNGCRAGCLGFDLPGSICGNGTVEPGEACEAPTMGCDAVTCKPASGYTCPTTTSCLLLPYCGDGVRDPGEGCDDGNDDSSDGCGACVVDVGGGYVCAGSPSTCVREQCGDGTRTINEACDDGNLEADDGCDATCVVESGWVCPRADQPCLERCGDGVRVGDEECDDNNVANGDGCNAACRLELGFTCPDDGEACVDAVCGNQIVESGEGCDFDTIPSTANPPVPVGGDGCGPTCQNEPVVERDSGENYPDPVISPTCGDGLLDEGNNEECDDGNSAAGDGCDACEIEEGWQCPQDLELPEQVELAVTYRDFLHRSSTGGHPDFKPSGGSENEVGIPGPVCTASNNAKCESVPGADCGTGTCGMLDVDGKPVHHIDDTDFNDRGRVTSPESFGLWYRSTNPYDSWWGSSVTVASSQSSTSGDNVQLREVSDTLVLNREAAGSDRYTYQSSRFFPLTGIWNSSSADAAFRETLEDRDGADQNFLFTTELRYFFKYEGGEVLEFVGDDDVWVYVNGRLAVDIGGLHKDKFGRVVLGDDGDGSAEDSDCSVHNFRPNDDVDYNWDLYTPPAVSSCYESSERSSDTDSRFGLVKGNTYEIVLFQAERSDAGSNFNLTLEGFLSPTSACSPICGDGLVTGYEVCDDGTGANTADGTAGNAAEGASGSDVASDQCNHECTMRAYCGDSVVNDGEACDDGLNQTNYSQSQSDSACAPGCEAVPYCGDGVVEPSQEFCDNGNANSAGAYGVGACLHDCTPAPYCGNGQVEGSESCDRGVNNGVYNANPALSCSTSCQVGPHCGDGVRNGNEACDDGNSNNDDACSNTCTENAFCGNGIAESPNDDGFAEQCDYGAVSSTAYGSCTAACLWGPHCGDGSIDAPIEECDDGAAGNDGSYNGCSSSCVFGPRCGDGSLQATEGEACDNGFNQDSYAFASDSCGEGCQPVPFCGDGQVQSSFEFCDEGDANVANGGDAYDGCWQDCSYGPYCGDGEIDAAHEACDDGLDNTAYSATGEACGYDCQPAAFCGDGQRNGPEQCDRGAGNNTGAYGGCRTDCTRAPYCGDNITNGDESCDDGPTGSLRCSATCVPRETVK